MGKEGIMTRILRVVGVVSAVVLSLAYRAEAQQDKSQAAERLASFEMTWPKQRVEAVAARARAAAEAMTGQELRRPAVVVPIRSASDAHRMRMTVPGAPSLEVLYLADYDELRIIDTELAACTAPRGEMPQDEALKLAKRAFDELVRRNLVNRRHYAWDNADVASTWVGGGSLDGKTIERKRIEYRITLRRSINGIELANAGVRIAIHTSGRVSGLRLGGVVVASQIAGDVEEPIGKGRWLSRQVALNDLQPRIERELAPEKGKAKIAWSRVMYVMPENKRSAVVAPLYVVSYSLEFPSDSGETAVSRRKTVGFSLVDPKALPVDLTPPLRAPQTEKSRKRPVEKP
jgi:hypothetical protein